jgi:hypothetical protein
LFDHIHVPFRKKNSIPSITRSLSWGDEKMMKKAISQEWADLVTGDLEFKAVEDQVKIQWV